MKFAVLTKDARLFEQIRECFQDERFSCDIFHDHISLIRGIKRTAYDLLVMDADMDCSKENPVFSWMNCHSGHGTPVILVGHFRDQASMTAATESGAADFVTRPIDIRELYARSLMALRRSDKLRNSIERCVVSNYALDKDAGMVYRDNIPLKLTSREFSMAWLFFSNPGVYFSRKQIATMVWGSDIDIVERTLEQHIYKLRKKLGLCKNDVVNLRTIYSLGYKLEVNNSAKPFPSVLDEALLPSFREGAHYASIMVRH